MPKKLKMTQVPWMIMLLENDCENCERAPICTYKDLVLCFMSNTDQVVKMTKEEAEKELKQE